MTVNDHNDLIQRALAAYDSGTETGKEYAQLLALFSIAQSLAVVADRLSGVPDGKIG